MVQTPESLVTGQTSFYASFNLWKSPQPANNPNHMPTIKQHFLQSPLDGEVIGTVSRLIEK
jgi:hypothetical protein